MSAEQVLRRGSVVAALTPFVRDGTRVDRGRFAAQIEALGRARPVAVTVGAVESQEFQVLGRAARLGLVDAAVAGLPAGTPVVAGVSSPSLRESIALAREGAARGAAVAAAVASPKPWGAAPTPDEAHRWFALLADASPLPILLYNNPRLGVDLSVETIARICAHPNVVALKETSRDEGKLLGLVTRVQGDAHVYTNMELLFSTLLLGGSGAMLPTPGLPVAARLTAHVEAGEIDEAARLARFFADFPSRWTGLGFLPAVKAAAGLMGCDLGPPVYPWSALDAASVSDLREFLATWELLDHFTEESA
ncbi:4-hydroxy-tetrahydrodipicolinate synthase [Streptomyces zhaozhouensis]|uniref:4-hydroxy-tetrahydrodipicolinate synthase n=1 Tax=Streptomyces zhaozhouensis TaxID=1300267 RepID=A0A286DTZ0_9ACTN|nr:dihydrodipicolinate synthase family protein [Streptomyces zhaozhouensis]SOD62132.1 4-hydroxy-tetrahydrodipicolinate synthase [Streptomyces zhaozhouensis]